VFHGSNTVDGHLEKRALNAGLEPEGWQRHSAKGFSALWRIVSCGG